MTSKHATNTRDIGHQFDYTESGKRTALAGNQGLTTKTEKESQVADIQLTPNTDEPDTSSDPTRRAFELGYGIRSVIDALLSDPLAGDDRSETATVAVAEALIEVDPDAPCRDLLEAIMRNWRESLR